ncbi:TPA: hypothetical protein MO340_004251 [Salmonella enterica subsp. salamae serovar 35:g,m,s,t:-]|nr:hypothetical protein [Salmonella enterica subsp. salamae serovar 35:g,m,s,t:-]HCA3549721.1 hypothetical protein [Salmonella enterica subsp. salamae serovar 35:g,m,s,t:-]
MNALKPKFRKGQRIVLSNVHPSHDISKREAVGHVGVIKNMWEAGSTFHYRVEFYAVPGLRNGTVLSEQYLDEFNGQKLKEGDRFYFGYMDIHSPSCPWVFYPETVDEIPAFDHKYALDSGTVYAIKQAFLEACKTRNATIDEGLQALEQLLETYKSTKND